MKTDSTSDSREFLADTETDLKALGIGPMNFRMRLSGYGGDYRGASHNSTRYLIQKMRLSGRSLLRAASRCSPSFRDRRELFMRAARNRFVAASRFLLAEKTGDKGLTGWNGGGPEIYFDVYIIYEETHAPIF